MTHEFWQGSFSINAANANAVPPPQPFPTSHANCGDNEVEGKVGGGVDGKSANCGNNEIEGKVGGGGNGLSPNCGNNEVKGKVEGKVKGKVV